MSLRNETLDIETGKPFENCKLGRQKFANVLTDIVSNYIDGFVLAINNKWGTGKTTFVKMWKQDLEDKGFQTVYFNAWENDFQDNPLIALMGELKTLTNEDTKPKFQKALKNAAILSKHIGPVLVQALVDKYIIDTKNLKEAIVSATNGLTDIFENEVNNYEDKKLGIEEFRLSLSTFIANSNEGKPIIFIIDELDRCRPNYAVAILEQIKHFFSVPNIVFVLSIDKIQLGNAIRGVYGSDKIDANEYLRRFIDLEYSIPEPSDDLFYIYYYEKLKFDEFFKSPERNKYNELAYDKDNFLRMCKTLFNKSNVSLRQQERILILSRLSLRAFDNNSYVFPSVYLFLNYIKVLYNEFYLDLKSGKIELTELQEKFKVIIKNNIDEENTREIMYLEAYLLMFYYNHKTPSYQRTRLYEKVEGSEDKKLIIQSIFGAKSEKEFLATILNIERTNYNATNMTIMNFINRIDLLETVKL